MGGKGDGHMSTILCKCCVVLGRSVANPSCVASKDALSSASLEFARNYCDMSKLLRLVPCV